MNLAFQIVGMRFGKITWTMLPVIFDIEIQNPNRNAVTIDSINGQLLHEGNNLGSFSLTKSYTCPGNNELTVLKNITVNLSNTQALKIASNKLFNTNYKIDIQARGTLVADKNPIPFDFVQNVM